MATKIHDVGYRRYGEDRAGLLWAVQSLALHSIRRALGLKRSIRHKIAPAIAILVAFTPAVFLAGAAVLLDSEITEGLINYGQYFGLTSFAVTLFAAAVTPGVLTTDRTNGMLALYLASPLNRTTYLLARAGGIFAVMSIVTTGPILFLIIANTFADAGPSNFTSFLELVIRAICGGAISAAFMTGLSVLMASIPRRWGTASVLIAGSLLVPNAVLEAIFANTDASNWWALLNASDVVGEAWERVLNDPLDGGAALDSLGSVTLVGVGVAYGFVMLGLAWWRYQVIEIER